MKKNMKKHVILTVCLMLVVCVASIGGTIAWLTDKTDEVTNTFNPSNISLELDETIPGGRTANMIPGGVIAKDPKVTITNDVDAYLFVTVKESSNLDTYIEWKIADGWEKLSPEGEEDAEYYVYYRVVPKDADPKTFGILEDDQVNVLTSVTKKNMEDIADNQPTLTFQAFTIQKENGNGTIFSVEDAWNNVKPTTGN